MATRLQRLRRGGLSEPFLLAGPSFRKAAPWLLAGAFALALATRLHPAIRYAVWGSDSGEYQFLTRQLVDTGRIVFDYDGWGLAYPYFPGMFAVSGAAHAVLGVDLFLAVQWMTPILAATVPVLVGLLAYRVTSDPRVGALAAAFAAVAAPIVLTTSHAMPGTLGQVFLLGVLALLPDAYRDRANLAVMALLAAALLFTHHLTTYFAVGILALVAFYREMTQHHTRVDALRVEVPLVLGLTAGAAAWWLGVAAPFREEIVGDALPLPPLVTATLFLLALAALPALVWLKRRSSPWTHGPHYPSFQRQKALVAGTAAAFVGAVLFAMFVTVPGTSIRIGWPALVYVLPVVGFLAFLPLGHASIRFHRHGSLVLAWLYAILASLAFASLTSSRVLFPFRHVDYMVMAMAPLAAVGMVMVYDQALASRVPGERGRARGQLLAVLAVLLVAGAALSLPPRETIGGFEEGITDAEMEAVRWVAHNGTLAPGSTIAADHRVSSLLFGLAGMHPTWDYTPVTYHSASAEEALDELASAHVPPRDGEARVDYVFLSPEIEKGVTLLQWENSDPMSPEAIAKFDESPRFQKVYDEDGVRIYRVVWAVLTPPAEGQAA